MFILHTDSNIVKHQIFRFGSILHTAPLKLQQKTDASKLKFTEALKYFNVQTCLVSVSLGVLRFQVNSQHPSLTFCQSCFIRAKGSSAGLGVMRMRRTMARQPLPPALVEWSVY